VGSLNNLKVLSLNKNPITLLPDEIGNLINLEYLSIRDTKIVDLPDSITKLDVSNGGSLKYISISDRNLTDKIKNKLPNCEIIID
jgi:Leucine-rich repeat (LRR) protein